MFKKLSTLILGLLFLGNTLAVILEYEEELAGTHTGPGGNTFVVGLSNDQLKSLRYLKVRVGDVIDKITWGVGYFDNTGMQYFSAGGNGGVEDTFQVPVGDYITKVGLTKGSPKGANISVIGAMKVETKNGLVKNF